MMIAQHIRLVDAFIFCLNKLKSPPKMFDKWVFLFSCGFDVSCEVPATSGMPYNVIQCANDNTMDT